ncbi:MAG: diguanylate cyclase [Rubrivivax sp.]|nr:diguanylate cyclase [Rubrivivax sp.]
MPSHSPLSPSLRAVAALAVAGLGLVAALAWLGTQAPANRAWVLLTAVAAGAVLLAYFVLAWRLDRRLDRLGAQAEVAAAAQRELLDAMEAAVVLWDSEGRLVVANRDFRTVYAPIAPMLQPGVRFEDMLRAAVAAGLVPEAGTDTDAWIAARVVAQRSPGLPMLRELPGGRWRRIVEQRLSDGSLLAHSADVTEVMEGRAAAERARQQLQDAIDALPEGFAYYDADDRLVVFNQRYREVYAASAALIQHGVRFADLVRHGLAHGQYPEAQGREQAWLAERLHAHHHPSGPLLQGLAGNRWVRIEERRTRDGGIAGVRNDVTDLVQREQALTQLNQRLDTLNGELAQLSDTDALTGLPNRRHFDRRLAEECGRAARHGVPLALLIFDVDHFKRYNDRHGHPAGDACLRRVAEVLREMARRPTDLVARIGGEEFAMLLPHFARAEAQGQAERCLAALDAAALPHGDSPVAPQVTVSGGGVQVQGGEAGLTPAWLLARADAALYAAKQAGRRRVLLCD